MKITVYIPCHDNETTVGEVAGALRRQTRPADQFLFINDRCTDRSPDIARSHGFEVVDLPGRGGLAAGRNLALRHCSGDVLLGFDADAVAEPNYLEQLEKCFQMYPRAVGVGGRLEEKYTQAPADLWRAVHMPQHHGSDERLNPRLMFGSTMACRVDALRYVGGWNEKFLTNFEDFDLSVRLRKAGMNYLYSPVCRAWHLRRDTVDTVLRTHWNWNYFGFETNFSDLATWLKDRTTSIWMTYRSYRLHDAAHPSLPPITARLPWGWTVRDLFALQKSIGHVGNIAEIATLAADVFEKNGAGGWLQSDIHQWLMQLIASLEDTAAPGPLQWGILQRIARMAYEAISPADLQIQSRSS